MDDQLGTWREIRTRTRENFRPADELKPMSKTAAKRLRSEDTVGLHMVSLRGEAGWFKVRVIDNDTRNCLLSIQQGHGPMESISYGDDKILAPWP